MPQWCCKLASLGRRFAQSRDGNIAITFGLVLIPVMAAVGAGVDYSRANSFKALLQASLDSALLARAKDGTSSWSQTALNVFQSNLAQKSPTTATPSFGFDGDSTYTGSVSVSVPTSVLCIVHIDSMTVTAAGAAVAGPPDNSCILTLDHGQPKSHIALTFNGAPIVNLTGCTVRSNTSLDCNGHDGNITVSIASGTASDCGRPKSNAAQVPDIYADLAKNITTKCGSNKNGVNWTAGGAIPTSNVIQVSVNGYTEYHICGNLNLDGNGWLTGSSPSSDSVIIVENGSINIANNASISTAKTAIVMTGNNTVPSQINFPNGNGKQASFSISPPADSANPWQGVSLYQDPKLTYQVDDTWGPGADFNADGLVYLPYANVVTDGNTSSNNIKCTKFVMNSLTTNGKVDLTMSQSASSCGAIGLKQWGGVTVHLIQ